MKFRVPSLAAAILSTVIIGCGDPESGTLEPPAKSNMPGAGGGAAGGATKAKSKAPDAESKLMMPGAKGTPTLQ